MNRCLSIKSDGNQCSRLITDEKNTCWQHKNSIKKNMSGGQNEKIIKKIPHPLATINTFKPKEIDIISLTLNKLIADSFALYLKSKNFHWHLSGSHFRDYHLLFDEQADQIFESIDILAERVRKIGGLTIHSISEITKLQSITDDNNDYVSASEMIKRLLVDNEHMAIKQKAAVDICDKYHDVATSNILQTLIDETERRVWFLFELTQN